MVFLRLATIAGSDPLSKTKMGKKKKRLNQMGLSLTDVKGNFRDIPTILGELEKSTSKMGNAQKLGFYGSIFGAEASTAFINLGKATKNGFLKEMIDGVEQSKNADKKMATAMNATTKGAVERMMSSFSELAIVLGNVLLPTVTDVSDGIAGITNNVSIAGEKFPVVTGFIVKTSAALFAFKVVSLVARFSWTLLSDALIFGKAAMDFFRLSTIRANLALLANPIGLVIIAVAALGAAVYKYWEPIKAFGGGMWDGLKTGLKPIIPNIDKIGRAASGAWDWLKKLAEPVSLTPEKAKKTTDAGSSTGLGIGESISGAVSSVKEAFQPVSDFMGGMFDGVALAIAPIREALAPLAPIFTTIATGMGIMYNWVVQLFTPVGECSASFSTAAETGKAFGIGVGAAIGTLVAIVMSVISGLSMLMTAIGETAAGGSDLINDFMLIGGQVMDGLLNGITAGYAKVKAKVLEIGSSIQNTFKSTLGIHSPSRVFSEFGGFINQGLQIGLTKSKALPIDESTKIADGVATAFDVGMGFDGGVASPVPQQGVAGSATQSPMTVSIIINQLPGENSEELADRIMAKIEQKQQLLRRGKLHD
jgi:hypothetical protein